MRKPGIVIFAAIINFISALLLLMMGVLIFLLATAALMVSKTTLNIGIAYALFIVGVLILFTFVAGSILLGMELLKGKGWAWYGQIVASILGLLLFPIGTLINAAIIALFLKGETRDFFKV